jgi:hypothetical protein
VTAAETPAPTPQPASERADTVVAVLNGTTTNGLAAATLDRLEAAGYQGGNTDTAIDQTQAETTVFFRDGHRPAAADIARILDVSGSVQALDAETEALASQGGPRPDVVVMVGADQVP